MKRRDFLLDAARLAALTAVIPNEWRVTFRPRYADDPFSLGVACGDPTPNSAIIWTRLAPRPLEPDGGMGGARVGVNWQVADDEQFTKIVKNGRATAAPELGFSLHVDVTGLEPDRWYFYRFTTADATSPIGRLRTTPAAGIVRPLSFAVVSCQHYETGLYTAYKHLAAESNVDLVTHLGDYIYEYGPTMSATAPRKHASTEVRTLDQYRARYAQYKSDPMLQAAHARCPWEVVWDDHEVDNNYAGLNGEGEMESEEQMRARRAAAYQAWWEHQPVRVPRVKDWADLRISRSLEWGATAKFWMIDTRQYRANQACDDGVDKVPCGDWDDPKRQFMGAEDEKWLEQGLAASNKTQWQVIGNQTIATSIDSGVGPDRNLSMDSWSGYPAAQKRFLGMMGKHAVNRSVVLTGDNHANWVNELRTDAGKTVAAEFVGTSITSGGDGSERSNFFNEQVAAENPQVRWQNNRRGYFIADVDGDKWTTRFRTVPFVTRPDAPVETASAWRLTRGRPDIEKV
jgi:alkaline phosphatase D